MATHARGASAPVPATHAEVSNDIIVSIQGSGSFSFTEFQGTRAQLEAEGLIPHGIRWPDQGFDEIAWQAGDVRYRLRRRRPDGAKGQRKAFGSIDWWSVRSERNDPRPWGDRILADKAAELLKTAYQVSAEGQAARSRLFNAHWAAKRDAGFQAFLARTPGLVKPARRRASKSEGGRHAA